MKISDCCGAPAGDLEDLEICPECREHCEWIDDEEEAPATGPFVDLGYLNGRPELPEVVKKCQAAGHFPIEMKNESTGDYEVVCEECNYRYRYDSSG